MARPSREPRDDVTECALDLGSDVRVGLGGQPQVVVGVGDRGMTHVGLQDRQQRVGVLAAGEPRPQIIHGHGVALMWNST